jgi:hypothetical protein
MVVIMNNPPAFPQYVINNGGAYVDGGMTLRDYFAAKAMQAVITGYATQNKVDSYSDYWAGFAYEMADAMLMAREA